MRRRQDDDEDEIRNQDELDAQAETLYNEQQIREKIVDDMYGVGGVEPDPEDLLYD